MSIINIPIPIVNNAELNFFGETETGLVNLNQVITYLNEVYKSPSRKRKTKVLQDNIFRSKKFAEQAINRHCKITGESILHYADLLKYDSRGYVTNLSQLGLCTIKTKKGKYGGSYIHLGLLLGVISNVDGYLTDEVQEVLVNQDILGIREENKSAYRRLMSAINRNPKFKKDDWLLSNVGKLIKKHLEYENINNLPVEVLEERKEMVNELEILIRNQFINSHPEVKRAIQQMELRNISNIINLSAIDYTTIDV